MLVRKISYAKMSSCDISLLSTGKEIILSKFLFYGSCKGLLLRSQVPLALCRIHCFILVIKSIVQNILGKDDREVVYLGQWIESLETLACLCGLRELLRDMGLKSEGSWPETL